MEINEVMQYNHTITEEQIIWMNSPEVLEKVQRFYDSLIAVEERQLKKAKMLSTSVEELENLSEQCCLNSIKHFFEFEEKELKIPEPEKLWSIRNGRVVYRGSMVAGYFIGFIPPVKSLGSSLLSWRHNRNKLKYITLLPNTLKKLDSAFNMAKSLESVCDIPDSVVSMQTTFYGDTALVKVGKLPKHIKVLYATFYDCESLVDVPELPADLDELDMTFHGCRGLRRVNTLPKKLKQMNLAFSDCSNLEYVCDLPDDVVMAVQTFQLTSITKPPKLPKKLWCANSIFRGCDLLEYPPVLPANSDMLSGEPSKISKQVIGLNDGTQYEGYVYIENSDGSIAEYTVDDYISQAQAQAFKKQHADENKALSKEDRLASKRAKVLDIKAGLLSAMADDDIFNI